MRRIWQRIRGSWNRSDTLVITTNTAALIVLIGNCWWESVTLCIVASAVPLALQVLYALRHERRGSSDTEPAGRPLRYALLCGLTVGALWPLGEGVVVHTFGWWGSYVAPAPRIWETPINCILIGWHASAYCAYLGLRLRAMGFRTRTACAVVAVTAFGMGVLGENLFVWANMWVYEPSVLDFWDVPAFVPVGYGLAYAALPLLVRRPAIQAGLIFNFVVLAVMIGMGLITGFYPR